MSTKTQILRAIRQKCCDCACYQPQEIKFCPVQTCDLFPYRLGVDPNPSRSRGFAKSRVYADENQQEEVT